MQYRLTSEAGPSSGPSGGLRLQIRPVESGPDVVVIASPMSHVGSWSKDGSISAFPVLIPLAAPLTDEAPVYRPDEGLPLKVAATLPELGGHVSSKQLWSAIKRGDLSAELRGRTYYVTPTDIAAWRENCRVQPSPLASNSKTSAETRKGRSPITVAGSSSIEARSVERDAALMTVRGLREHLPRT